MRRILWIILALTAANLFGDTVPVWRFNQAESVAGWYGKQGLAAPPAFGQGAMELNLARPYAILAPRQAPIFPAACRYLRLKLRVPKKSGMVICYFATDSDKNFAENKKLLHRCNFTGEWQELLLDCGANGNWKGKITGIRIDFDLGTAGKIELAAIGFYRPDQLPVSWDFTAADSVPWNWGGGCKANVENGVMKLTASGKYITSKPVVVNFDAAADPVLKLRVKSKPGKGYIVVYYRTAAVPALSEKQKVFSQIYFTGKWQNVVLKMASSPAWKGTITGFRLDFGRFESPLEIEVERVAFAPPGSIVSEKPLDQRPAVAPPQGKRSDIPAACTIGDTVAKLENAALRAVFQLRPHLGLRELFCAEVAKNVLSDPEKTSLFLLKTTAGKILTGTDATVGKIRTTATGFQAELKFPDTALQAIFSARVSADELHLNLEFFNTEAAPLDVIAVFPHFDGIAISENADHDYYFLPMRHSGVIANRDCLWQINYGERGAFWQMLDVFSVSRGGGLYLRCNDPEGCYKGLTLRKGNDPQGPFLRTTGAWPAVRDLKLTFGKTLVPDTGTGMTFDYYRRICTPEKTLKFPEAVIGTHAGDWRNAMKRYAAWSMKTWPPRSGLSKLAKRWDICGGIGVGAPLWKDGKYRSWYLNREKTRIDVVELISWWTLSKLAPWNTPFDRLNELVSPWKAAIWPDPATGKKVYSYNLGDYDGYNPQWGGLPALKAQLRKIRDAGQLAIFYMDPILVCATSKLAKKAPDLVVINPEWKYKRQSSRTPTFPPGIICDYEHYRFCIDNPEYSRWAAATVERVCRETGVGGIRLDEYGGPGPICKSSRHRHQFGGDGSNVWLQALTANIRLVREGMDRVNPDLVLMTEFFGHDMMASKLDGCLGINLSVGNRELAPAPIDLCRFYFPHCKIFEIGRGKSDSEEDAWHYRLWNAVGVYNSPLNPPFVWRILNENNDCFARCGQAEPLVETLVPRVYANRFASSRKCIWTLLNMT
ncbi:MAG: hypothetical protein PHV59_10670, partial [Victivallales bacterium]|nr:hypothetical protein [Victivallales bacterium]